MAKRLVLVLSVCLTVLLISSCGGGGSSSGVAFNEALAGYYRVFGTERVCVSWYCEDSSVDTIKHVSTSGKMTDTNTSTVSFCSISKKTWSNTWTTAIVNYTISCSLSGVSFTSSCYLTANLATLSATSSCVGSGEGEILTAQGRFSIEAV